MSQPKINKFPGWDTQPEALTSLNQQVGAKLLAWLTFYNQDYVWLETADGARYLNQAIITTRPDGFPIILHVEKIHNLSVFNVLLKTLNAEFLRNSTL